MDRTDPANLSTTEARGGETSGRIRWVLGGSLLLAFIAMGVLFVSYFG